MSQKRKIQRHLKLMPGGKTTDDRPDPEKFGEMVIGFLQASGRRLPKMPESDGIMMLLRIGIRRLIKLGMTERDWFQLSESLYDSEASPTGGKSA